MNGVTVATAYVGPMPERISREDVARIAQLARLTLGDDELDRFTSQLGDILDHARDLAALDLDGVAATAHPFPLRNVEHRVQGRDQLVVERVDRRARQRRDEVLAAAPEIESHMFAVPPVLGEPA